MSVSAGVSWQEHTHVYSQRRLKVKIAAQHARDTISDSRMRRSWCSSSGEGVVEFSNRAERALLLDDLEAGTRESAHEKGRRLRGTEGKGWEDGQRCVNSNRDSGC